MRLFPKYRKQVAAVIVNNKKILLVKKIHYKDYYKLPQGGIDEVEEVKTALLRELNEELNTDKFEFITDNLLNNKYKMRVRDTIKKGLADKEIIYQGKNQTVLILKYYGGQEDISLNKDEDLIGYIWADKDEALKIIFSKEAEVLKKSIDILKQLNYV